MEIGHVIEFLEAKRVMAAVITRLKGSKITTLTETNRKMNIASSRALSHIGPRLDMSMPRAEMIKKLNELAASRSEMACKIDIRELWELLEGEGDSFKYSFLSELTNPGSGPDDISAVFRAVYDDDLYFKLKPESAHRNSAEKIEQIQAARILEEKLERELEEGAAWLAKVWDDETPDPPDSKSSIIITLRNMVILGPEASDYKRGKQILEKAGLGTDPDRPFDLLVKLGEIDKNENLLIYRYDIDTDFSEQALNEARSLIKNSDWNHVDRTDLTHLDVITIDSVGSEDFDDAISLEETEDGKTILGVHIADVSALIHPDSLLGEAAMNRATSMYMPDKRIPMLPEILSEEGLSLKQGQERPVLSLLAEITDTGFVRDFKFVPSKIKVKRQLSYKDADSLVKTDLHLKKLYEISKALKTRRQEDGALIMAMPSLSVYLKQDGLIGTSLINWDNPGRFLITEMMVLANYLAAKFLKDAETPCIYRTQAEPSQRVIGSLENNPDIFSCLTQRRYLSRVHWSLQPKPHRGMGLDVYTQISSPLRRFFDLIIQHQVKSAALGRSWTFTHEQLTHYKNMVEPALKNAINVQTSRKRYWLQKYFETLGSRTFEALVVVQMPYKWRLFISEFMLDVEIDKQDHQDLAAGDVVMLKIKKVNARANVLKFDLI